MSWDALSGEPDPSLGAPPSLKTDDGRALRLRSVKVRGQVRLPIAFTELELTFDEISGEGATFSLDLPADAAVSRFAVDQQGTWQSAEPLSFEQAQAAFTPVKSAVDKPGGPQNFSVRVVPQPGQRPRLLIAYTTRLSNPDTPYQVRLAGMSRLDELDVSVRIGADKSRRTLRLARSGFTPDRDFSLSAAQLGKVDDFLALRAGKYALVRLRPETKRHENMTFLVDTSASQPVPLEKIADFLLATTVEIAREPNPPLLTVVAFDQEAVPIVVRAKPPLLREQLAPLVARGRLGGTDMHYALSSVIGQGLPREQVVWVSDHESSIKPLDDDYRGHDEELARMDSLVADPAAEKALRKKYDDSYGYKPQQPGVIARLDDEPSRMARLLLQPTPVKTSLLIEGASWSSAPDDEYAHLREAIPEIGEGLWAAAEYVDEAPLLVIHNGKAKPPVAPVTDEALAKLLEQAVGGARVNALYARLVGYGFDDPAEAARGFAELEELSKQYGLLSPLSSFAVPASASGGKSRYLAGRAIDPSRTRLVVSTTLQDSRSPGLDPKKCPELVGISNAQPEDQGCPPLYIDFREGRVRLIADVSFGGAAPLAQQSPHLDELAQILTMRPELVELGVSAPTKAQAEGVVRYLVQRGISAERLEAERLLEGVLPARKATPKCKNEGVQVLLEARKMNLQHINRAVLRKPLVAAEKQPEPSRLSKIQALVRSSWRSERAEEVRTEAMRLSEAWVREEPKNPVAYVALGESHRELTERAYGSLFDLQTPGAGLDMAGAVRFQQPNLSSRAWNLAMGTFRQRWQDAKVSRGQRGEVEGSRAHSYAALLAGQGHRRGGQALQATDSSLIIEAADFSPLVAQIEAPVFAHVRLMSDPRAYYYLERALGNDCRFPMKGSVLGAMLSYEDPDAEIEISVTATKANFTYDSVLSERAPGVTLKWLPLPENGNDYPITVSVRATRLGKTGYAFGMVRELNYTGRGRVSLEQRPFVVTQVGESVSVYEQVILQRPQ